MEREEKKAQVNNKQTFPFSACTGGDWTLACDEEFHALSLSEVYIPLEKKKIIHLHLSTTYFCQRNF